MKINIIYQCASLEIMDMTEVRFDATALVQATWEIVSDMLITVIMYVSDGNGERVIHSTEVTSVYQLRHNVWRAWTRLKPKRNVTQVWVPQFIADARGDIVDINNTMESIFPLPNLNSLKQDVKSMEMHLEERHRDQFSCLTYSLEDGASDSLSYTMLRLLERLCTFSKLSQSVGCEQPPRKRPRRTGGGGVSTGTLMGKSDMALEAPCV
jgi:hypothetical protein